MSEPQFLSLASNLIPSFAFSSISAHSIPLPGISFLSSITHFWDSRWISPESSNHLGHCHSHTSLDLQQSCPLPCWGYLSFWNSHPWDQQWSARKIGRIPLSLPSTKPGSELGSFPPKRKWTLLLAILKSSLPLVTPSRTSDSSKEIIVIPGQWQPWTWGPRTFTVNRVILSCEGGNTR